MPHYVSFYFIYFIYQSVCDLGEDPGRMNSMLGVKGSLY